MAKLDKLLLEWENRGAPDQMYRSRIVSMTGIERDLLALKEKISLAQAWSDLILKKFRRNALNMDYLLRLAYVWDERPIPVTYIQRTVDFHQGNLYRTFIRGGMMVAAKTRSVGAKTEEPYWPWRCEAYLDPLSSSYLRQGLRIEILEEDNGFHFSLLESDGVFDEAVPLPIYRSLFERRRLPPPMYKAVFC